MGRLHVRRLFAALSFVTIGLLLSGCEFFSSPQNTFAPEGTVAEQQKSDFLIVVIPSAVIGIIVMVGLVAIMLVFRRKDGDPGLPKQVHGHTGFELTWTILPALLLVVVAVPTLTGIRELAEKQPDEALTINVIGVQWAWQFEYPEYVDASEQPLLVTGDLHIPVDEKIDIQITSLDVNHSFWVPKLAGKTDAIQNHPNHMWIEATKPGTYEGQCAEFCGLSHAEMRFRVIAMERAEFDQWVADQGGTAITNNAPARVGVASSGE